MLTLNRNCARSARPTLTPLRPSFDAFQT